jgi:hypothetical protein
MQINPQLDKHISQHGDDKGGQSHKQGLAAAQIS